MAPASHPRRPCFRPTRRPTTTWGCSAWTIWCRTGTPSCCAVTGAGSRRIPRASALPQTGGSSATSGGGIMAVLTSYIGDRYINELRAYYSQDRRSASPVLDLPEGRVQVASDLSGDTRAVSTLSFGGNPSLPQSTHNSSFETTDELSWLQGAAHRVKLGVYFNATRYLQDVTSNQNGVFTYPSLDALEEGRPSLFTRTLAPTERAGTTVNTALYLGDSWRHGPALQLTYGARLEASSETGAPPFNGLVDSLFAMRTDRFPHDVQVSPRLGFTWIPGAAQGVAASTIIRGGTGGRRVAARVRRQRCPDARLGELRQRSVEHSHDLCVERPGWRVRQRPRGALGAPERVRVRSGIQGAQCMACVAWGSAARARASWRESRRELGARRESIRV